MERNFKIVENLNSALDVINYLTEKGTNGDAIWKFIHHGQNHSFQFTFLRTGEMDFNIYLSNIGEENGHHFEENTIDISENGFILKCAKKIYNGSSEFKIEILEFKNQGRMKLYSISKPKDILTFERANNVHN